MIGTYYTVNSEAVNMPPLELDTKSIYKAIVMMIEQGYELVMMFDEKPMALMRRNNERLLLSEF